MTGKHRKPYIGVEGVFVKVCGDCGAAKPLTEYNRTNSTSEVLRSDCKDCVNARSRAWREANPDKCRIFTRETRRAERLNPRKLLDKRTASGIICFLSKTSPSKPTFLNTTVRNAVTCISPRICCWLWVIATKARSLPTRRPTPSTAELCRKKESEP